MTDIGLPSDTLNKERYWRLRAEECRTLADDMHDPICRRIMEGVALSYEAIAERTLENIEIEHSKFLRAVK